MPSRRSTPCVHVLVFGLAIAVATAAPRSARADDVASGSKPADAEITSDTAAQFYEVRSPTGETVIARRRLMTTLGVSVYDLLDRPSGFENAKAPTLTFRARMRYDADYGGNLSALVSDFADDARRRMAAGAYLRRHGLSEPTSPEADLIESELAREARAWKKRRRARRVA